MRRRFEDLENISDNELTEIMVKYSDEIIDFINKKYGHPPNEFDISILVDSIRCVAAKIYAQYYFGLFLAYGNNKPIADIVQIFGEDWKQDTELFKNGVSDILYSYYRMFTNLNNDIDKTEQ